jgi:hypothetical protein
VLELNIESLHGYMAYAILSSDRKYRYVLTRRWSSALFGPVRYCVFCLLNPSTAAETADDPTVRKCVGFAKRWGFGGCDIVNLFAWRATDPNELYRTDERVGAENDRWLLETARKSELFIAGWGNHGCLVQRSRDVIAMLQAAGIPLQCFGITKNGLGEPKHPLYLSYKTPLQPVPLRGIA